MDIIEISDRVWQRVPDAVMELNRKPTIICSSRLRAMYDATKDDDFRSRFEELANSYDPPEKDIKLKQPFKHLVENILRDTENMNLMDARQYLQYLIWNVIFVTEAYNRNGKRGAAIKKAMKAESGIVNQEIIDKLDKKFPQIEDNRDYRRYNNQNRNPNFRSRRW